MRKSRSPQTCFRAPDADDMEGLINRSVVIRIPFANEMVVYWSSYLSPWLASGHVADTVPADSDNSLSVPKRDEISRSHQTPDELESDQKWEPGFFCTKPIRAVRTVSLICQAKTCDDMHEFSSFKIKDSVIRQKKGGGEVRRFLGHWIIFTFIF